MYKRKNWLEAFEDLKDLIRESKEKKKVVMSVFFSMKSMVM